MTSAYLQIRHYRMLRNMKLGDLAKRLGMSPSQLSKLETGKAKLTIETATRIAAALDVPVVVFLSERSTTPTARRSITRRGAADDVHESHGMRFETLCSGFKEKQNLFWRTRISARSVEENGGWRQHPGQEFIYMLSGRLELHTQHYDPLLLSEGDSILFDADQPHAYVAPDGEAEMLMMNGVAEIT